MGDPAWGVSSVGSYLGGTGWKYGDVISAGDTYNRVVDIIISFAASAITSIAMTYNRVFGQTDDTPMWAMVGGYAASVQQFLQQDANHPNGVNTWSWTGTATCDQLYCLARCHYDHHTWAGSIYITSVTVTGTGANPFGTSDQQRGDAFYYNYNNEAANLYAGTNGLVVDGAKPAAVPAYNSAHSYTFEVTGTGAPFIFEYNDADFTDNDNIGLVVTVNGPNMGYTV